jgi:hypothetical protein
VSVLVVAQSSSEIPEGLTNNPVLISQLTDVWTAVSGFAIKFLFSFSKMFAFYRLLTVSCILDRFTAFGRSCTDA